MRTFLRTMVTVAVVLLTLAILLACWAGIGWHRLTGSVLLDVILIVLVPLGVGGLEFWLYTKLYPPQPRNML